MKPPQLDVENPIEVSLIKLMQAESAPPPLTFPEISHGLPIRGLFLSAIAHELVVVVIFLFSFALSRIPLPASRVFNETIKLSDAKGVIGGKSPARLAAALKLHHVRTRSLGGDIVVEGDL